MGGDDGTAAAYRAPDGSTWGIYQVTYSPIEVAKIKPSHQNADTGQWRLDDDGPLVELPLSELQADYTPIPAESLRDPRIMRLAELVNTLISEHEAAAGGPLATADEIRDGLAYVATLPEEIRKAVRHGIHVGAQRGRRQR
ncbi:MAG: hypothetical protein YHS30scaffold324_23 [Catenulispora phage 69_17]|jgi:hypothetical protein|nr:MAG: hypothetical protein YHS30scaffold324_23 [Catenulispora phage 69_17]